GAAGEKEGHSLHTIPVFVDGTDAGDLSDVGRSNQQLVLVGNVEFVQSVQRRISARTLVRLYRVQDDLADFGTGRLYFSALQNAFKILPRLAKREVEISARVLPGAFDNLMSSEIERGLEIVDCVSDDDR